ncbi:NAD-dependent epimerase/dehydratase family protein [Bacillaceae bacterium Marseille-Q3522]|nr:NAD-dependent epimerase/dehydratase family protein [Bacillaceae bacterium Marseille-Q3522]
MKILLLGGTKFLGKHIAKIAFHRGHKLTLFHRGKTNPDFLQHEVHHIIGDRTTDDIEKLTDNWDVVIDTSGQLPEDVKRSVKQLKNKCELYVYISSISAYKDLSKESVFEEDELADRNQGDYAGNKSACEQIVNQEVDHYLIIRPGLIVGPDDPTDRFTYWPWRMSKGGNVLVPNVSRDTQVQFIDVRDLAAWIISAAEKKRTGSFNATGPKEPLGNTEFLEMCRQHCGAKQADLIWAEESFLEENDVKPWIELPLWLPESLNLKGMMTVNCDKAILAGLVFRSVKETIADTLEWSLQKRKGEWLAGLDQEKEKQLLKKLGY